MSWTNILIYLFLGIHVLICFMMVFIILMQRSKQEGLGAAFGGSVTDSMFGAQTSQVLVKTTVWLAAIFFILTITLARLYATRNIVAHNGGAFSNLLETSAPATPADKNAATPSATDSATTSAVTPTPAAPTTTESAPATTPAPAPAKK